MITSQMNPLGPFALVIQSIFSLVGIRKFAFIIMWDQSEKPHTYLSWERKHKDDQIKNPGMSYILDQRVVPCTGMLV